LLEPDDKPLHRRDIDSFALLEPDDKPLHRRDTGPFALLELDDKPLHWRDIDSFRMLEPTASSVDLLFVEKSIVIFFLKQFVHSWPKIFGRDQIANEREQIKAKTKMGFIVITNNILVELIL
jgi:hypothetical protein